MRTLIVAAMLIGVSSGVALAQDAAKGANVFKKCMPCHNIGPSATNKIGPELNGLDGRHSASAPDYAYSEANKKSGIVWNKEMFEKYINDPRGTIPERKWFSPATKTSMRSKICGPMSANSTPAVT